MTPDHQWDLTAGHSGGAMKPSRDTLALFCGQHVPRAVFMTVSGAHLYGFPSADSDVDLRGAFQSPTPDILGLAVGNETVQGNDIVDSLEVEFVAHELGKYLRLLIRSNGYVLEQILSPLVVLTSPVHTELCSIARESFCRRVFRHYRGFASGVLREYHRAGSAATIKQMLYAYRVLMTGIVLLEEGILEANVNVLSPRFGLDLTPLIEGKSLEKTAWQGPAAEHEQNIQSLFERLERSEQISPLPDELPNRDRINEFLVRKRLEDLQPALIGL